MIHVGSIMLWSGTFATIPFGWALCDGNNGTPDLRDKFVVGAGGTYSVDETGGGINHDHTYTGDGHDHYISGGPNISAGTDFNATTDVNAVTGTTDNGSSLPPYWALAYIMRI